MSHSHPVRSGHTGNGNTTSILLLVWEKLCMAFDPEELSLPELDQRNNFLKNQLEGLNKAARARGGVGANKDDEQAREFSQKQVSVENEIYGRLMSVHQDRSEEAQTADESKRAEKADSPQQWKNNPNQFDWPGIDTPR